MLLRDIFDVTSYLLENKKSLKILSVFQAILAYYVLIQVILMFRPLTTVCKEWYCGIAIYFLGMLILGLIYLLIREKAKCHDEAELSPEDAIREYISNISWKDIMGTNNITEKMIERFSLGFMDLLINRLNAMSLSKAVYKMTKSILSIGHIILAFSVYFLLWVLSYLWHDVSYSKTLFNILNPSFRNLGTGLILYVLVTLITTMTTGLLSPLTNTLKAGGKRVCLNSLFRYGIAMLVASLFPYFVLDEIIKSPGKPDIKTYTVLYKINSGDPLNPEFVRFVQVLFESGKYVVYSPVTREQVTRESFEKVLKYQFQNVVSTTPAITNSVYLIYNKEHPENISIAIFSIESELRYNLKKTQKEIITRRRSKTIEKTTITDPKQIYVLKIVEIASESVIQGILVDVGKSILGE